MVNLAFDIEQATTVGIIELQRRQRRASEKRRWYCRKKTQRRASYHHPPLSLLIPPLFLPSPHTPLAPNPGREQGKQRLKSTLNPTKSSQHLHEFQIPRASLLQHLLLPFIQPIRNQTQNTIAHPLGRQLILTEPMHALPEEIDFELQRRCESP